MLKSAGQLMNLPLQVRVIIVKLADRLHNMRTLSHMPPHKQVISIDLNNLLVSLHHSFGGLSEIVDEALLKLRQNYSVIP